MSRDARNPGPAPEPPATLSERRLLSFYDRLRERIVEAVERRGGDRGARTAEVLLLVPDVFMLLVRLVLDRDVPASTRALLGGALAYFLLPADLMPEIVLGAGGFLDDLILACVVLAHAFGDELQPYAGRYWSGPRELRQVLADLTRSAEALLGVDLYARLKRLLAKQGIEVEG